MMTSDKHNTNCLHFWHGKLGHGDPNAIKRLAEENMANGIEIKKCGLKEKCKVCIRGKLNRKPFFKSNRKTKEVLEVVRTDRPMENVIPGSKRYMLTIIDDYSAYTEIQWGAKLSQ